MEEARGHLHLANQQKEDVLKRLEDVKLQLQFVQNNLEEQLLELHKAESMEREATVAAGQLEEHVRNWRAASQVTEFANILHKLLIHST